MRLDHIALNGVPEDAIILDCDVDPQGRTAVLWSERRELFVSQDGVVITLPHHGVEITGIRFVGKRLLVWPTTHGTALVADGMITPGVACTPREILIAPEIMYATYGETQFLTGTDDDDPARDRITAYDRSGSRLFGVDELLGQLRHDPDFNEFTQGTVTPDSHLIFVADGSPLLWTLDPHARELRTTVLEQPVEIADHVHAVLHRAGQAGLLRLCQEQVEATWFDLRTGKSLEGQSAALPGTANFGAGQWRTRSVAHGEAVLWRGQTLLHVR